MDKKLLINN